MGWLEVEADDLMLTARYERSKQRQERSCKIICVNLINEIKAFTT